MVKETIDKEKEVLNDFNTLLDKYEIDTNKNIQMIAKYNAAGTDITKGIKVEFEEGLWKTLGDAEGIEIVFDNHYHGLFISKSSLKSLEKEGIKSIEIRKKNDKYTIIFLDLDKKVVDKASASVQFSLPAENQLASIIAEYKGGKDNWGGQYNASNGTLEFMTRYSGEYSVLDKEIVIEDIGDLEDSQQQAIRFMVSKDYFSLDEDKFYPNEKFTRYDFTTALTNKLFMLLYDTEPVSMDAEESEATEETGIIPMVAVGAIAVAAVVGGLGFTVFRKKHK